MFFPNFFKENANPKILCLGAHCDDIEIGCGGTILKIIKEIPGAQFYWVVFSGSSERKKEAEKSAKAFLKNVENKEIVFQDFRESYFPFIGDKVKDYFESLKKVFSPDVILSHFRDDAHQDHRLINSLTWNTFRNHLIFEYEIPKYDGDFGVPNAFFSLEKSLVDAKIDHLTTCFKSQSDKQWFDKELFRSMMRLRGMEANSSTKYAEAFYCRKIIF